MKTKKLVLMLVVAAALFLVADYILQRPRLSAEFSKSHAADESEGEPERVQGETYFPFGGFLDAWDFSDIFSGGGAARPQRR